MSQSTSSPGAGQQASGPDPDEMAEEHFKPVGTIFLLAVFVATLILLWASVYVILISRGVTT